MATLRKTCRSCSFLHPERMEITQPRVARNELPWGWRSRRDQTLENDFFRLTSKGLDRNSLPMPRKLRLEFPGAMYHVVSRELSGHSWKAQGSKSQPSQIPESCAPPDL